MFLSWVSGTRHPSRWKPLMASMQTPDIETRKLRCSECHLDDNQSKNCPQADHTLLLEPHKTPRYALQVGPTILRARAHCGPCVWQSNKGSCLHFTQTLSLHFYSALVNGGHCGTRNHTPRKDLQTWFLVKSQGRIFSDALARWRVLMDTTKGQSDMLWHHVLLRHTGDSSISSTTFLPKTRDLRLVIKKCRRSQIKEYLRKQLSCMQKYQCYRVHTHVHTQERELFLLKGGEEVLRRNTNVWMNLSK